MRLELGNYGHHFLGDEFFRGLPDQALVIGEIGGGENVVGRAGGDQEAAAAEKILRDGGSGHRFVLL